MKPVIVVGQSDRIGQWAAQQLGLQWNPTRGEAIGLERDGELIAAVLVEDHNGPNCIMHVAAKENTRWCYPAFVRFCFLYVFEQLGCIRVTGLVDEANAAARRLDEHLGFELEATLKGAAPGGDLLVFVLWKDKCRWIQGNQHELRQEQCSERPQLSTAGTTNS